VKDKALRPWLPVIAGGASLVSHAGATLLVETARRSGLAITLSVTNHGTSAGQTTCRVTDPADRTGNLGAFLLSPSVDGGKTVVFTGRTTALGPTVRPLAVECSAP